jgi:hypothetical protein
MHEYPKTGISKGASARSTSAGRRSRANARKAQRSGAYYRST